MAAFGIKAIQPQDNEHIFGFETARGTADMALLEVWNGPTQSDLRFTVDKEGQLQTRDGSAARPTYSFESDKDSGRYMSGAGTFLDVIAGTAVGTWTAGKLTLTELQVDNLNINTNTISSTSGAVNIVPVTGSAILLDGTISIDGGIVLDATSITSTTFVGALTGTASIATLANTVVVVDSTGTGSYIAMFDSATGSLAIKTDGGLTYNAGTGMLTATGLTGPLTGTASVATVATTVTITDNESTNEDNALIFTAGGDVDGGDIGLESDGTLTYNPSTGKVTATGFIGALTGNADTATLASTVTVAVSGGDATSHIAMFDSVSGSLAVKTDPGLTYNATTNVLTAAGFVGPLTGAVTGTASLATTVTITDNESDSETNAVIFTAGGAKTGGNLGLESDGDFHYNPSSGTVTATAFSGTATVATVATTVTITDNESTSENNTVVFCPGGGGTGNLGLESDGTFNYNPSTGTVAATAFSGTATLATEITASANDNTNETVYPTFVDGTTGSQGIETDADLTYNPSSGILTGTRWTGAVTGAVTGNVTGNCSGTALTVTQAAQSAITSVGTLTSLGVGDVTSTGDISLVDSKSLELGTGTDATISYTGTHLIVQPQVVGSGQFVVSTNTGSYPSLNAATVAIIQRNAASGNDVMLDLLAGTAGDSILNFSDSGYQGAGSITYDHTTPFMKFGVGENTEWMRCDAATGRNVGIGLSDAEQQLQVKDATYGFQIESSAATKNPAIVYETTDGIRWVNGVNIAEAGTDAFEFRAAGSVFALRLAYDGGVVMPNIPASDPGVDGELYHTSGDVKISYDN